MSIRKRFILLFLILSFPFAKPFPANAQTEEPTPEATPVVIEAPVEIPDDSTVIVVEAPEAVETEPPFDFGLLAAVAGIVIVAFFTLFGATVVKLGNSAPPWAIAAIIGGVDAVKPAVNKWVEITPTPLDNASINEVWKELEKLKTQVNANTADIRDKTEPGK